eukprot:m.87705 g.87705  ORF g.87705 m.87705 type:complete len:260 (-) comp14918_c0_seq1:122-901(-)
MRTMIWWLPLIWKSPLQIGGMEHSKACAVVVVVVVSAVQKSSQSVTNGFRVHSMESCCVWTLRMLVPNAFACSSTWARAETYPETAPEYRFVNLEAIENEELEALGSLLDEQVEDNLGMAMVFTLHAAAQEWLQDRNEKTVVDAEEAREAAAKAASLAELERQIAGTPVTPESFAEWWQGFVAEQEAAADEKKTAVSTEPAKKLTGKQLFQRDASLKTSDMGGVAGAAVVVDEDLFAGEDLGDLDLDDVLDEEFSDDEG